MINDVVINFQKTLKLGEDLFYELPGLKVPSLFSDDDVREKYKYVDAIWVIIYNEWRASIKLDTSVYVSPFSLISGETINPWSSSYLAKLVEEEDLASFLKIVNEVVKFPSRPVLVDVALPAYVNPNIFVSVPKYEDTSLYSREPLSSIYGKIGLDKQPAVGNVYTPVYFEGSYSLVKVELLDGYMKVGDNIFYYDGLYVEDSTNYLLSSLCDLGRCTAISSIAIVNKIKNHFIFTKFTDFKLTLDYPKVQAIDYVIIKYSGVEYKVYMPFDLSKIDTPSTRNVNKIFADFILDRVNRFPESVNLVGNELRFVTGGRIDFSIVGSFPLYLDAKTRELLGEDAGLMKYVAKLAFIFSKTPEVIRSHLGSGLVDKGGPIRVNLFRKY